MKKLIPLFAVLLLAGCSTLPFEPIPEVNMRNVDPAVAVEEFDAAVAKDFELLESVVFGFFGKELTGMGYVAIDSTNQTYALACMTPTGIKLFEFRGVGDQVETLFMPPQLEKVQDHFAASVAEDIRRMYLDWTPSENAKLKHRRHHLVFREKVNDVKVEYRFAGEPPVLERKRYKTGWFKDSTIRYFDYRDVKGKQYPYGVMLENHRYHYSLVLRVKEVRSPEELDTPAVKR